jgi:hypothetical protein
MRHAKWTTPARMSPDGQKKCLALDYPNKEDGFDGA